ncbi:hypothetical protein EVAR_61080_1 [Eumeta japonica]|uniref:Uncharacterized protein n=1 Tax=Eumeta variegata TaxID=151549 RepID=A0A4C1YLQ7_EUMVA|nr:hypothetical protein EVAR_61080_1 [Eumeta japonica]
MLCTLPFEIFVSSAIKYTVTRRSIKTSFSISSPTSSVPAAVGRAGRGSPLVDALPHLYSTQRRAAVEYATADRPARVSARFGGPTPRAGRIRSCSRLRKPDKNSFHRSLRSAPPFESDPSPATRAAAREGRRSGVGARGR